MDKKLLLANAVTRHVRRSMLNRNAEDLVKQLLADDGAAPPTDEGNDRGKLKVLNDGDGVRLLMSIYQDYVSDDDYVKFPDFMFNVDTLLYKARGNRALTREEREEMEDSAPKKSRGKSRRPKPRPVAPPSDDAGDVTAPAPVEVTSSDMNQVGSFFADFLKKKKAA